MTDEDKARGEEVIDLAKAGDGICTEVHDQDQPDEPIDFSDFPAPDDDEHWGDEK